MADLNPWQSLVVQSDPAVEGRWLADVDEMWITAMVPLGGITAAVAARAMEAELARQHPGAADQRLRSLHCVFVQPVPSGLTVADVKVLRTGRSLSQAEVSLHAPGEQAGLTAIGAFGGRRTGYEFSGITPPKVAPPGECRSFREPPPPESEWSTSRRMGLWDSLLEGRGALGLPPWDPTPRTTSEAASWHRFDVAPVDQYGGFDPLAILVIADLELGGIGQRIGYTDKPWFCPSVDLSVHLFSPPQSEWILNHNKVRLANDGYASVEAALWSPDEGGHLQLVAYGSQQVLFSFPEGVPSRHLRLDGAAHRP